MTTPQPTPRESAGRSEPLFTAEQRLQRALDAGGIGLWEYDPEWRVLHGSAATDADDPRLRQVRMGLDDFIARIRPDQRDGVLKALHDALDRGIAAYTTYEVERPDGQIRWIQTHLYPERDGGEAVRRIIAITRDVSDLQHALQAQEQLLDAATKARDTAERTVMARNNFISSTVHDLRTPMTSIRGRAQLLTRRVRRMTLPEDEQATLLEGLAQIELGIDHMNALLGDLQDAAFLQMGRPLELRPAPTSLAELVEGVVAEIIPLYPAHQFDVAAAADLPDLQIDPTRMRRVVTNLLINAAKYSPEGSRVAIRLARDGDAMVLQIRDEGIGIPAAELDRIFERFYRASNAPQTNEGSGIGLAGVRQIVRQHGGEVAVISHVGAGSTFTVRLPISTSTEG